MKAPFSKLTSNLHPRRTNELVAYLLKDEAISGKLILIATFLALLVANTALRGYYQDFWNSYLSIGFDDYVLSKDLRHWVDEGLMAFFFLVVGLELKRELILGDLRKFKTAILPVAAAAGGMLVPAAIYIALNGGRAGADGWAIPMATDIAFAIAILAFVGKGIPTSIRLFLLTLAIVDDFGAITVIAIFYNSGLNITALAIAVGIVVLAIVLNKFKRLTMPLYILIGIGLWLVINASGIHASIAGAILGFLAPLTASAKGRKSVSERAEHFVIPISTFIVVPLFAFANTGISLSFSGLSQPGAMQIGLGVVLGLVVGKVVGVIGASWLMIKLKLAEIPQDSKWSQVVGAGLLAGIGFTVSIFITELAFTDQNFIDTAKIAIFFASAVSAALGLIVLKRSVKISKSI